MRTDRGKEAAVAVLDGGMEVVGRLGLCAGGVELETICHIYGQ